MAQNADVHLIPMPSLQTEAKIFLQQNEAAQIKLVLEKVELLKQNGLMNDAFENLSRVDYETIADSLQQKVLFQLILFATLANRNTDAAYFLTQYNNYVKDTADKFHARWIRPIVFLQNEEWDNAYAEMLAQCSVQQKLVMDSIWQFHFPNFKNPRKAQLFSALLPGSGQTYAGKIGFGMINLMGVAASGYFIWWHWVHEYYIISAVTGGGWLSRFYLGGLKTSGSLTEKRNEKLAAIFKTKMSNYWLNGAMAR